MAGDDLAEGDVDKVAVLVDHGVQGIDVAQDADDLKLLLVQRIADQIALDRERVLHEAGGMEGADGLVTGDARRHHLAAPRPAGHEMRLDKAGGDAQIRLDEAAVDPDRRAARGGEAEVHMVLVAQGEVVLDPDIVQHPGSPTSSASSTPSLGRCRPVATRTVMRSLGMPAATIVSIMGRRNRRLGTGRVISQIRMQALPRPWARSPEAAHRSGCRRRLDGAGLIRQFRQCGLADHCRLGPFGHAYRQVSAPEGDIDGLVRLHDQLLSVSIRCGGTFIQVTVIW